MWSGERVPVSAVWAEDIRGCHIPRARVTGAYEPTFLTAERSVQPVFMFFVCHTGDELSASFMLCRPCMLHFQPVCLNFE